MKSVANIKVRFAPSPTGFLHIGNARTALFNWLFARHNNGKFILRIEDTDVERSNEKYTKAILEDLRWLGLDWDSGPYKQSLRNSIYKKHFLDLEKKGFVYPCYCTPEELEQRRQAAEKKGEPPRYDNRCRHLTSGEINKYKKEGRLPSWRFKVHGEEVIVKDIVRGDVAFDTSLIGDFVILKQDGNPTFNFAVSVDDMCMGITHIIRGEDHLSNTPRHILLWEAFEYAPPALAHCPLIFGPGGERLSKRYGAVSVREYEKLGYLPDGLLNYLALLGWSSGDKKELFTIDELIRVFSLEGLSKGRPVFNKEKLDWINSYHIRNMDLDKLTNLCVPYLKKAKLLKKAVDFKELEKMISAIRNNLVTLAQCPDYMKIFLGNTLKVPPAEYNPKLFKTLYNMFSEADEITTENIKEIFSKAQQETGITGKQFYMPIRLALTGMAEGPELLDVIPLISREKILKRLCQF